MTPRDLSYVGWQCNSRHPAESRCVVGGHIQAVREIDGILVRSPTILEDELECIVPADRNYVAAEMNAFLVYWLTAIERPVLNRPTPRSLGGPGWYPEHWTHCAGSVGLNVLPRTRSVTATSIDPAVWADHGGPFVELTLVGDRTFGEAQPGLIDKARRLARASGVSLVTLRFDSPAADARFLMADPFPDLEDGEVASAVLECLTTARDEP